MEIDKMTIGEAREIAALFQSQQPKPSNDDHWNIGGKYFLRTVTHHHTGVLVKVTPQELVLTHAAWIADDGRLTQSLASGDFNEVEMFPSGKVIIGRGSLIDAVEINTIPTSQK
jgi:hypothetical protein